MTYNTRGSRPGAPRNSGARFGGGSSSRNSFSGPRRFGGRPAGKRGMKSFSDVSKFINKAVITEEVEVFKPEHSFNSFELNPLLKKNILAKGYENPTPIQDRAIPHVLRGEDIVGIANTGTGKTGAFLIPLINKVLNNPTEKVLIVAPVRELAMQIDAELREFAKGSGLFSVVVIGGASMGNQIRELRGRHNFVIGTPGRIKDHIESRHLSLSGFKTVVLDEADRMLDMGFIGDMRLLMSQMAPDRHTLFFSATISREIEGLIHEFLKTPVRISVKTQDTAKNIDQDVIRIQGRQKFDVLRDLLSDKEEFNKTLVFARTKHGADKLAKALTQAGVRSDAIHGNKQQNARQRVLEDFKKGIVAVLVATDVAARGLDIKEISHVINYDLPATYEDYVHRIGRTGRAEKKGKALTFIE
ncbi:MAG: DEAD/DEAH box helicase [Candidatus Zambryskibacteria bacterium]|nr:DEAD/DEAH box helicase [Candidatus Zambryskibacteria bacterium]